MSQARSVRSGPMMSSAAATGLAEVIEAAGRDPDDILRSVGLDRTIVTDRHAFIPSAAFTLALEEAARVTGDECFGLHFGERYHPKDIGALAYVVLNSPTIAVAFENVARYLRIYNEAATVSFTRGDTYAYLQHRLRDVPLQRRQHEEYALTVGLGMIRMMAGSDWRPLEVRFEHEPPGRTDEHARVFGAPVLFRCDGNVLVVERDFCERPVPAADRRLYPILEEHVERQLETRPTENRFLVSVRTAIGNAVKDGEPRVADVARAMGVSVRTLQRRLGESGVDYRALVDDIRHERSLRYLRDRRHTLSDVAYLLGYSEISAFSRAFRRWTGATPSDYRRRNG